MLTCCCMGMVGSWLHVPCWETWMCWEMPDLQCYPSSLTDATCLDFLPYEDRKKPGSCKEKGSWLWVPPAAWSSPRSTTWHQKTAHGGTAKLSMGKRVFSNHFLTLKHFCWIHSTWNVDLREYWHYLLLLRELESKGIDLHLKLWEQLAVSERLWSSQGREHNRNTGNTNSWRADHVLELPE